MNLAHSIPPTKILINPGRIYVASSWKNTEYDHIMNLLSSQALDLYNFKTQAAFHWHEVDQFYRDWKPEDYVYNLYNSPIAKEGFDKDFEALESCDTCILILPCNRSSHLELGYARGRGKNTAILLTERETQAELMYRMVDYITPNITDLLRWLGVIS